MTRRTANLIRATAPRPFEELGHRLQRMIEIKATAYPDHWPHEDRLDLARRQLLGEG